MFFSFFDKKVAIGLKRVEKVVKSYAGHVRVEVILETFSVYFPEVIFDDFLEPTFWGPRWRFGVHVDQKVAQKGAKSQQKTRK